MNALSQLDEAFKAVKEFADQFPGNKEIRLMLSELLRASSRNEEAREQLEKLASDLEARGDTVGARKTLMRLQALDAEGNLAASTSSSLEARAPPLKCARPTWSSSTPAPRAPPAQTAQAPKGPASDRSSRKTRAVPTPSARTKPASGLPLIEVPDVPVPSRPVAAGQPPLAD